MIECPPLIFSLPLHHSHCPWATASMQRGKRRRSPLLVCSYGLIFLAKGPYIRYIFCGCQCHSPPPTMHGRPQVGARVGNRPPPPLWKNKFPIMGGGAFCYFISLCGAFSTMGGGGGFFQFFSPCICLFLFLLGSYFELHPPPPPPTTKISVGAHASM